MKILLPLLISFLAGLSTVLGSLLIFLKISPKRINKFITFSLAFSLSIMIGVSITDLIPNAFYSIMNRYNMLGLIILLPTFAIGYFVIKIISRKTILVEEKGSLYKLGILNMLVLVLHNFPEGIATFLSSYQDITIGLKLSLAIMLHNIPEGIAIAIPIYYATHNKNKAIKSTLLSGLAEPLGALLAYFILSNYITNTLIDIILLFVSSLMITLSIEEMLPKAKEYNENHYLKLGISAGVIVIVLNVILFN